MTRWIDADELTEKLQGFAIIIHPDGSGAALECHDCGGYWDVTCPEVETEGLAHVNLNTLLGAAADHDCEMPDMTCPAHIAISEEEEAALAEEIEVGIASLEDFLEQITDQEE